jgi:hypothetical protein
MMPVSGTVEVVMRWLSERMNSIGTSLPCLPAALTGVGTRGTALASFGKAEYLTGPRVGGYSLTISTSCLPGHQGAV